MGNESNKLPTQTTWFLRKPREWGILQFVILFTCVGLLGADKVVHLLSGDDFNGQPKPITSAKLEEIVKKAVKSEIDNHTHEIKLYINQIVDKKIEKHELVEEKNHSKDIDMIQRQIDSFKNKIE